MALKYYEGRRVEFFVNDVFMRGWFVRKNGRELILKGVDGKTYSSKRLADRIRYDTGTLDTESFGVRVFDTILADNCGDTVSWSSHAYWKELCRASGWQFNHERIHSLSDLKYFFGTEAKPIIEPVIIFNGHGLDVDNRRKGLSQGFGLSNGEVISKHDDFEVLDNNKKKILIFSSCLIGKNKALALGLKRLFDAEAVFTYDVEVTDSFCYMVESYLLTLLNAEFFCSGDLHGLREVLRLTRKGTDVFRCLHLPEAKKHPLVMY